MCVKFLLGRGEGEGGDGRWKGEGGEGIRTEVKGKGCER